MARGRHPHSFARAGGQAVAQALRAAQESKRAVPVALTCDMTSDCTEHVTHLGEKGYIYCSRHAPQRQGWERTRTLRAWEIRELLAGRTLPSYTYKARDMILSILKRTYYNA